MRNQYSLLGRTICLSLLSALLIPYAAAQQTCETRRSEKLDTRKTYLLASPNGSKPRSVVISCTDEENSIKVALRNPRTRKPIQTLTETQNQNYPGATTPDLDNDGFADLVLITEWNGPNMAFKAWRYDPVRDRLELALDTVGTAFVRTKNGRLISVAKGGADSWGHTTYRWSNGNLVPEYSIDEAVDSGDCDYYAAVKGTSRKTISNPNVPNELKSYCGIGGAGLIENGQDLLGSTSER